MPTYPSPQARVTHSFETFNVYARRALEGGDDADILAFIAVAFEISQLRYHLSRFFEARQNGG